MAALDLLFGQSPLAGTPTDLVFGDEDEAVAPVTVEGYVQLGGVTVSALAVVRVDVSAYAVLGGVTATCSVTYDNRVTRWTEGAVLSGFQVAEEKREGMESAWNTSLSRRLQQTAAHQTARALKPEVVNAFTPANARNRAAGLPWGRALPKAASAATVHETGLNLHRTSRAAWTLAASKGQAVAEGVSTARSLQHLVEGSAWQVAGQRRRSWQAPQGASRYRIGVQSDVSRYQTARRPGPGGESWPPVVVPPEQYVPDTNLVFMCPPLAGSPTFLVFGIDPCELPEVPVATVVVPIRRVYMVQNSGSLRRVDGDIPLPALSMTLSIDWTSWTWGFTADLPASALADLAPSSPGVPVELEAIFNGTAFRAVIEPRTRNREFGKRDLRIVCRGKTALLDRPYAPALNFSNAAPRTAQQLMEDVLTLNGEPLPWTVNWGLEDWLVPSGVFVHNGSYITALNAIAAAAGGYIQPHATLQSFSVLPRYPVAPWEWGDVTPDFELPSALTTKEGIEWIQKPNYNRVYVSGQQSGVLGRVTRGGTAGDELAPMVIDALITAAAAARQRGLSILGDTGEQANVSLRLPVLPETGVIVPGKFVRYTDEEDGSLRVGLVRSLSMEHKFPQTWQTIGVETHVQ